MKFVKLQKIENDVQNWQIKKTEKKFPGVTEIINEKFSLNEKYFNVKILFQTICFRGFSPWPIFVFITFPNENNFELKC